MLLTREVELFIESDVATATGMDEDCCYPDYSGNDPSADLALGMATRAADFAPRRSTGTRIKIKSSDR